MNEHAAETFNEHARRTDGQRVVRSLNNGLGVLGDTLFVRLHADVERRIGTDSMLMPVSEATTAVAAKREIEIYHVAQCAVAARQRPFLAAGDEWFVEWLVSLRLEAAPLEQPLKARLFDYLARSDDGRQMAFTNMLAKILPESTRAPLVLFTLYPLAVTLAVAQAFGDEPGAEAVRRRQASILPAIHDCSECRGRVLENGEKCRICGNPLWTSEYLTAAD